ncbi:aldo/keto reductase [Penicillium brevicompactum]|uniref:Aldo/keto reductase n=2 Tax=Penicillium brevicompactum TaxID=5074 RepID=A0A9W9RN84_PENBR|nr:aldo/keto reductase [Penicillium brevicompactum]KAJ5333386.1 aldo/keto reductase [Penicillium brevicompactum]KAJ5362369.1 aldo/keto reductase [Penicillium brevicompactum]
MSAPQRTIGRDGPKVSAMGLGLMSIGSAYGQAGPLEETVAFLDHAHATGQRFWDTADAYQDSEDIIGEWFKRSGKRDDIFIATKFGFVPDEGKITVRSDPEHARAACDTSLKRLGIDTIDLYYCHRLDGITPIEKTIEALVDLKNQGKIRYIGLSECSASTIRRAHAIHPISAFQIEYSPFALDIEGESEILSTCRELGISVIAYSPIGRGILSGQIKSVDDLPENDFRRMLPKYSQENFPKILELVKGLQDIAKAHDATSAQVSLAWLQAQGPDIIPIPGTKSTSRMDENAGGALLQLTEKEVKDIRELIKRTEVSGARYPDALCRFNGRDSNETPPL